MRGGHVQEADLGRGTTVQMLACPFFYGYDALQTARRAYDGSDNPRTRPERHLTGPSQETSFHGIQETGLDYFGARYYSGAQGRFTSPDVPLLDQDPADPQSWNLYAYARNNPLKYIDPTGNAVCSYSGGTVPEGGAATTEKACTEGGGTWVYQATDSDDPNADASAFQFSITKTEYTDDLNAAGQELFQGNAQLWNNTAGVVNATAVATGAVVTLPVVVPAVASAVGNAVGFGYGISSLGTTGIVLGRYPTYVDTARAVGARALNIPNFLYRGLDAIGEGWTANKMYIDTAIRLGKQIYLSNSPTGQGGSIYAQELQYLQTRWGIAPSALPRILPTTR